MATTPPRVRFYVSGVPFTYDVDGRPWKYAVTVVEPAPIGTSRFVAGMAEWRDGGFVMTRALSLNGNPNVKPIEHVVIMPAAGAIITWEYIGPEDPHDDDSIDLAEPEPEWHRQCSGCWRTVWHSS